MNAPLIAAGSLGILGAAIHGVAGELLVVRKIAPDVLPPTRFGGASMTKAMIHVTWHLTTVAFLTVGVALVLAGSALEGDTAHGIAVVGAVASTGFATVAALLGGAHKQFPRVILRHPAPILLTAAAVLAWIGAA